jgi:SH3-like domain-containing protein
VSKFPTIRRVFVASLLALLVGAGCNRQGKPTEYAYVAARQANLRDRVAALYNKTGTLKNGERVEVLDRSRRFVKVKDARGETGWIEERYLVGDDVYRQLAQLARENQNTPVQAHGEARLSLRMHVTPGRDTPSVFELAEGDKVEILKRSTIEKARPPAAPRPAAQKEPDTPEPPMEDWLFVRDAEGHAGWVLSRMVDVDLPLDVAQYSEGQRIVGYFVLNRVHDNDAPPPGLGDDSQRAPRDVGQYLVLYTEPKDGMPWDYDQVRVFTWNLKRHHYETAYRERKLFGLFPARVGTEDFGNEGVLPVFSLRIRNDDGTETVKKYRLNGPIVRRVLSPGEEAAAKAARASRSPRKRR